jgi:hypothetical protein
MAICLDLLQSPTGTCQQEQPAATVQCKPRNTGAEAITLRTAQVPIVHLYYNIIAACYIYYKYIIVIRAA